MANKNGAGRVQVALANQVKAFNLLGEVLIRYANGKVAFKEGWNDQRIANEAKISLTLAAHIRRKNFGSFSALPDGARKPTKTQTLLIDLTKQVEKLTAEVEEIWEALTEKRNA
jgi:hypothetical protein